MDRKPFCYQPFLIKQLEYLLFSTNLFRSADFQTELFHCQFVHVPKEDLNLHQPYVNGILML